MNYTRYSHEIDGNTILKLEQKLGITLPGDYKEFLQINNVCMTEPRKFFICNIDDIEADDEPDDSVQLFLGFSQQECHTLKYHYEMYVLSGRVSKNLLPIAYDPGGSLICIGTQAENFGNIFFWDHEKEAYSDEDELTYLAPSFEEFISSLI